MIYSKPKDTKKTTNIIYLNNQINIRKSYETSTKPNENS